MCSRSNTPLVKTIVLPAARSRATRSTACSRRHDVLGVLCVLCVLDVSEANGIREAPSMAGAIDADVVHARLHAERIQQPVIVVRVAVALVHGDIELVGALDQVEAVDGEGRVAVAGEPLGIHFFQVRVRAVAAHAVGVEQPDAEHEVVGRLGGVDLQADRHRVAGVEHERRLPLAIEERDVGDLHFARSPAPSVAWDMFDVGSAGMVHLRPGPLLPFPPLPGSRLRPPAPSWRRAALPRPPPPWSGRRRPRASGRRATSRGPDRATAPRRRSVRRGSANA